MLDLLFVVFAAACEILSSLAVLLVRTVASDGLRLFREASWEFRLPAMIAAPVDFDFAGLNRQKFLQMS